MDTRYALVSGDKTDAAWAKVIHDRLQITRGLVEAVDKVSRPEHRELRKKAYPEPPDGTSPVASR